MLAWRRGLLISSPTATEEKGLEIESHQGRELLNTFKKFRHLFDSGRHGEEPLDGGARLEAVPDDSVLPHLERRREVAERRARKNVATPLTPGVGVNFIKPKK
jgi:hypothetical protein